MTIDIKIPDIGSQWDATYIRKREAWTPPDPCYICGGSAIEETQGEPDKHGYRQLEQTYCVNPEGPICRKCQDELLREQFEKDLEELEKEIQKQRKKDLIERK